MPNPHYDSLAGLDLSSLASVTQTQIMQAINQIGPLNDIGGILCFDGNSLLGAGSGFPDVTTNPRFVRYIWIDTQVRSAPSIKRYKGTYVGTPANPSAMSNTYLDWGVTTGSGSGSGTLQEIIYYPYLTDGSRLLNHATKYIEYLQTGSFPQVVQAKIKCVGVDSDYAIDDEVTAESVQAIYPGNIIPGFNVFRYSAGSDYNVRLSWPDILTADMLLLTKARTAVFALDKSKWAPILYLYQ